MPYINDVDIEYINGYMRNIRENYPFSEVECELRAGQTSKLFEGNINKISISKFRKLQDYYDNFESSTDITIHKVCDSVPSLDITFKTNSKLNPGIDNLRFSLNGRPAIYEYCSKNTFPDITKGTSSLDIIYKDSLTWDLSDQDSIRDVMKMNNYKTYNNIANVDMESIRTRMSGKVELVYDFKTGQFQPSDVNNAKLLDLTARANKSLENVYDSKTLNKLIYINRKQLEGDAGVLLKKKIPLKRFATVEELDVIISMLVNPLNTYMTGATIAVDGGLSTGL